MTWAGGEGVRRDTSGQNTIVCEETELVQKCKEVSVADEGQGGGGGGRKNLMQTAIPDLCLYGSVLDGSFSGQDTVLYWMEVHYSYTALNIALLYFFFPLRSSGSSLDLAFRV